MRRSNTEAAAAEAERERLLRIFAAATFLIFFQGYMVAPLIPRLAGEFGVSPQQAGFAVPAYLVPYGVSTLFYGLLSDRIGRRRLMLASFVLFVLLTAATASAATASQLVLWRFVTGCGASGVVPLALALLGELFPYERRGRPLGWLFGAMAGGMAFGSTFGVLLEPLIGWRALFVVVGGVGTGVLVFLLPYRHLLGDAPKRARESLRQALSGYAGLVGSSRGARTYAFVLLNAVFHSGVFTWLGLYLTERYGVGEFGIGLALLGYGVPGFLLGPLIGRAVDRWGRHRLLPAGLVLSALAAALLALDMPLVAAALVITLLSLGYDTTQPLLAGIVTDLAGRRAGQAMGLNVFALFVGFGVGSLVFGELLRRGFTSSLVVFAAVEGTAALFATALFRNERSRAVAS